MTPGGEESDPSNRVFTTNAAVDRAEQLSAVPDASGVLLTWPALAVAPRYKLFRWNSTTSTWTEIYSVQPTTNPAPERDFQFSHYDPTPLTAAGAEYKVESYIDAGGSFVRNRGFVVAKRDTPVAETRGKVLLVVDRTFELALANSLATLRADLIGDGWQIFDTVFVDRDTDPADPGDTRAGVAAVKNIIETAYTAPAGGGPITTVILVGHVPVPYSGKNESQGDGHGDHIGAWVADSYYGDVPTSAWPDQTVNIVQLPGGIRDPENRNVPGDGKFDESRIPSSIELAIGRIDFARMSSFYPSGMSALEGEAFLLNQYFAKNHAYRLGDFAVARKAIIDSNGGLPGFDFWGYASSSFGGSNVQAKNWVSANLETEVVSWMYSGGTGNNDNVLDGGHTRNLLGNDVPSFPFVPQTRAVFNQFRCSWMGDWDKPPKPGTGYIDSLMNGVLAADGVGLASIWSGLSGTEWFMHRMATGGTLGESFLDSINGNVKYSYGQPSYVSRSILGDPTLRLHVVAPIKHAEAFTSPAGYSETTITWDKSADDGQAGFVGYRIYRSAIETGPYSFVGEVGAGETSFTDAYRALPTPYYYMIRAVKLESTPSGTYYNTSTGVIVRSRAADPDGGSFSPQTSQQLAVTFDRNVNIATGLQAGDVVLARVGDDSFVSPTPTFSYDGGINKATFTYANLPNGNYRATVTSEDVRINDEWMRHDMVHDFFVLAADATRDRRVDSADFAILSANYNQSGKNFFQGNFDYDPAGNVNISDYAILSANYNAYLAEPANAPGEISVSALSSQEVEANWIDDVSGEEGWRVQYRRDDETEWTIVNFPANTTGGTISGLADGTKYWLRVRAYSNAVAPDVAPNTAYTPKKSRITMLPAPTNLFVTSPSTGTTNLTWANNASNDSEVVVQRSFDLLNWSDTVLSAAATSTSHNDLLTGQHVYYRVFARNALIDSAPSITRDVIVA